MDLTDPKALKVSRTFSFDEFKQKLDAKEKWSSEHPIQAFIIDLPWKVYRGWHEYVVLLPRKIKWFIQRGRRGYCDCDVWNMNNHICDVIIGMVKKLQKNKMGWPSCLGTEDEGQQKWNSILEKILKGFELKRDVINMDAIPFIEGDSNNEAYRKSMEGYGVRFISKEETAEMNEGLKLFIEYLDALCD